MSAIYERYKNSEFGKVFEIDGNRLLMKDGDQFFVIGQSFTNLQESDDYAFGDTALTAIKRHSYRNADSSLMSQGQ